PRPLEAAELFDPKTGKWSSAGSVPPGRFGHVAVALADGRVLVAGGRVGGHDPTLPDAAVYDPTTGAWTATGSLASGRSDFAATLLKDGRVFVTGGWPGGHSESRADAELFDAGTGKWSTVPHLMTARRAAHSSTRLSDGSVLLAGGTTSVVGGGYGATLTSAEIFDPLKGAFTEAPSMRQRRSDHSGTLLPGGKVLIAGYFAHHVDEKGLIGAEIFDPVKKAWSPAPEAPVVPGMHTAALLSKNCGDRCGSVLLIGSSENSSQKARNFAELFGSKPLSEGSASEPAKRSGGPIVAGVIASAALGFLVVVFMLRRRARLSE
ncbi:MAG: Kelch repeat-containing protein, partial [Actinomycetota bacterium]